MLWMLASAALAVCGDGLLDAGETCDDGNVATDDGCNATCQTEYYWECEQPPEPFAQTVSWAGVANCSVRPAVDLAGRGAHVALPDWEAFSMRPTGASCMSYWSSGDQWLYRTEWQAGPYNAGVGDQLPGPILTWAQCLSQGPTRSTFIDPQGQRDLYLGLRDSPCSDNRGAVELVVRAVSDCEFKGDLDGDGVLNDDDACPTVYNHLPEPYAANLACVSELATWDDAEVGARALVHRDAVISGTVIGPKAEIGVGAHVGPGSVVMRSATVGAGSQLGPDTVLGWRAEVGAGVLGVGGAVQGMVMYHGAVVGDGASIGENVVLWPFSVVGDGAFIGAGSVLARLTWLGPDARLGTQAVLAPQSTVGAGSQIGNAVRLRRGAAVGEGCTLGDSVRVGRDGTVGDGATVGDDAVVRGNVPAGATVGTGEVVPR